MPVHSYLYALCTINSLLLYLLEYSGDQCVRQLLQLNKEFHFHIHDNDDLWQKICRRYCKACFDDALPTITTSTSTECHGICYHNPAPLTITLGVAGYWRNVRKSWIFCACLRRQWGTKYAKLTFAKHIKLSDVVFDRYCTVHLGFSHRL